MEDYVFLHSLRSAAADFPAGDFGACVAGGLGGKIVGAAVDDYGAADDILHAETVREKDREGVAAAAKEGRQIPGVLGVGAVIGIEVAAHIGKGVAAAAGAAVTHVDASKGMVAWAKENAVLSGLADAPIRYIVDDCVKFVEREIRRGNRYDAIIMDPPSYGRGPKGEIWKIEDQIHSFVRLTTQVLKDEPLFFLINSYTTGLQPAVLSYLLGTELRRFSGKIDASEIGLPVRESGLVLPCGASGRFESSL